LALVESKSTVVQKLAELFTANAKDSLHLTAQGETQPLIPNKQ